MTLTAGIAIYLVLWWITLFAVLPWGVKSQHEANGEFDGEGNDPGAPVRPLMLYKVIATSLIALVVTAGIIYLMTSGIISLEDIPMPFKVEE